MSDLPSRPTGLIGSNQVLKLWGFTFSRIMWRQFAHMIWQSFTILFWTLFLGLQQYNSNTENRKVGFQIKQFCLGGFYSLLTSQQIWKKIFVNQSCFSLFIQEIFKLLLNIIYKSVKVNKQASKKNIRILKIYICIIIIYSFRWISANYQLLGSGRSSIGFFCSFQR